MKGHTSYKCRGAGAPKDTVTKNSGIVHMYRKRDTRKASNLSVGNHRMNFRLLLSCTSRVFLQTLNLPPLFPPCLFKPNSDSCHKNLRQALSREQKTALQLGQRGGPLVDIPSGL
mmetsp:Transcript_44308/g.87466  ORF Transcript_44308/g.87466 Transcript_44308/m.87466 type:complete len:115 (+) Transcript_44308:464-808(+)